MFRRVWTFQTQTRVRTALGFVLRLDGASPPQRLRHSRLRLRRAPLRVFGAAREHVERLARGALTLGGVNELVRDGELAVAQGVEAGVGARATRASSSRTTDRNTAGSSECRASESFWCSFAKDAET